MNHIALYRSWRPQKFEDMVGQEHITRTLQNSLREGRLSHAYLFSGPRGTGKTSAAKILAKAVNCERGPTAEPCNECDACRRITEGAVMDVIELDAASNNGVDEIRDIRDKVKYAPTEVRQKVYIIDEVHMLSIGASNALLKTLEEPPAHVMFILATTEPHKLPVTIISRCQRFEFRRVVLEEQVARLQFICDQEGLHIERKALDHIARLSDGGMRDALSLLDQIISFCGETITYHGVVSVTGGVAADQFERLAVAVAERDIGAMLQIIGEWMMEGKSAEKCLEQFIYYFRDVLMLTMVPGGPSAPTKILSEPVLPAWAKAFTPAQLFDMIDVFNHYLNEMKYSTQPQTLLEVAMMKACGFSGGSAPAQSAAAAEVVPAAGAAASLSQIRQLESKLEQMERQIQQLTQQGANAANTGEHRSAAAVAPAAVRGQRPAATVSAAGKIKPKLEAYISAKASPFFREVQAKWPTILQKVKERKITVHAWFMDGEPVSATESSVLVAFKNTIHRETTEKPANRQIIDQVLAECLQKTVTLETVMLKDWQEVEAVKPLEAEPLTLEPDDNEEGKHKEEWINEAVELFGEQLVVIKEE